MPCTICPRRCAGDRIRVPGFCGVPATPLVARAMTHEWEEPILSGTRGSGAVFFAGCNMRCVYCQNHEISRAPAGRPLGARALGDLFLALQGQGVHNIDLVSPMHIVPAVARALRLARADGLTVPVVYNTNAYELPGTLALLEGLVDIYLPDLRYASDEAATRYSRAPGYFGVATRAIEEMHRQVGDARLGADGMMASGVMVRVLVLPGLRAEAIRALEWIAERVPGAYVSVLRQYVPAAEAGAFREIDHRVTTFEYESVLERARALGLNGFQQGKEAASGGYTPAFGGEG